VNAGKTMNDRRGLEFVGQKGRSRLVFQTAKPAERVDEVEVVWIATIVRRAKAISTKFYMGS
jgi:hypothetical protein